MKTRIFKSISMIFALLMLFNTVAFASENEQQNDGLTLYSQNCPTAAKDYAISAYPRLLQGAIESGDLSLGSTVYLGTPFTISNSESDSPVYYFPIISDSSIVATLRVYIDLMQTEETTQPVYTGILSPYLADALNTLNEDSTYSGAVLYICR